MYRALGITHPLVYLGNQIKEEKYIIDGSFDPLDTTLPIDLSNSLLVSSGTVNLVRNLNVLGTFVIL